MEAEDIPETATQEDPNPDYIDGGEVSNKEISPTDIPDDIVIPPENRADPIQEGKEGSQKNLAAPLQVEEVVIYKSIWPPLIFSFILGITLGSLVLLFGPLGRKDIILPNNQNPQNPQPTQITKATTTQAHFNKGFTGKGGEMARIIALDRVKNAQTSIVWVTNFPTDRNILQEIRNNPNISNKLIFIGGDAQKKDAVLAQSLGLIVFQTQQTLDDNESFLIIDNNYIIDIGRPNTVWESVDPHVVSTAKKWLETLIKNSQAIK